MILQKLQSSYPVSDRESYWYKANSGKVLNTVLFNTTRAQFSWRANEVSWSSFNSRWPSWIQKKQKSQTSRSKLGARTGFEICCHVATYCFVYVSFAAAVIVPQICCSTFLNDSHCTNTCTYMFIHVHVTNYFGMWSNNGLLMNSGHEPSESGYYQRIVPHECIQKHTKGQNKLSFRNT